LAREEHEGVTRGATGRRGSDERGDKETKETRGQNLFGGEESERNPSSHLTTLQAVNCVCGVGDGWSCT
jgi:hypothetical protein